MGLKRKLTEQKSMVCNKRSKCHTVEKTPQKVANWELLSLKSLFAVAGSMMEDYEAGVCLFGGEWKGNSLQRNAGLRQPG